MKRQKMMKVAAICLAPVLGLSLTACSGVNSGVADAKKDSAALQIPASCKSGTPLISVLLPNQTNPYYVAMKHGFEDEAKAHGMKAEVLIAEDDDAKQLSQAEAAVQNKPCAVALNPVKSEPAAATVRTFNDAKIPVFTVNIMVDSKAMKAQGAFVQQYLGADNEAGGAQSAAQMMKDMGKDAKLNIGLVTEPDEAAAMARDEGFKAKIASDKNSKVAARVDGNVKITDALDVTTDMLQGNPNLNAIFASSGPNLQGALEAVNASGKDVKVYGFCAADIALSGKYMGCVAQEPEDYGRRVVREIVKYVKGQKVKPNILRPLKEFVSGQKPGQGQVG
ncbi:substrate-binding domain-containing protein [Bifidobacterium sp. ESL0775]|uniref:substrate-binding domain-containing protein n=1 Tax=Bifidobacterium sp. ESL0775 TaxID=2983230 RepID=UPI0023FA3C61|nr:substrate-binding domain-containing protein [Bifidobacterium sp. ESL0775]WEV69304.1 substrate-binding domain-containing protein [Bifidobacterium sp. ESL0775]